jgi:stage V sporulation protein B
VNTKNKQSFLHGALILALSTVIVKLIGACFKLPLANIIGNTGMGYFNTAYNLFNVVYALAVAGFPVAVAKMVSESVALKKYKDVKRIYSTTSIVFIITGLVGFLTMTLGSSLYCKAVANPNAQYTIIALAPTVFFACVMSTYRGYYEGLKNMYPTAISQVIEAAIKLVAGLGFSYLLLTLSQNSYTQTGKVFWVEVADKQSADIMSMAFAAAGAVLGVSVSTVAGAVYLWLRHKIKGDGITKEDIESSVEATRKRVILKNLIKIAIPVCLGAISISLTSFIDGISVMNRLETALEIGKDTIYNEYSSLVSNMPQSEVPNFLYGAYSNAQTLFNLIPAITTTFGISALPAVASAWALRDKDDMKKNVEAVLRVTSLLAIPAGIGMAVLAEPIIRLVYSNIVNEALISVPILRVLGIAVMFVSLMSPVNSMLQAVGRADVPVKLMLIGGGLKLVVNYVFVAIPSLNIKAAAWGTLVCYLFIAVSSVIVLVKNTKVKINLTGVFLKPLFSAILCGVGAFVGYSLTNTLISLNSQTLQNGVSTLVGIVLAVIVYVISLFCTKTITKNDILMLPKGEKLAKVLEKKHLIG